MGDRIAVLNNGLLQQVGTPQEMYERPANDFVAGFIGSPAMNLGKFDVEGGVAILGLARVPLSQATLDALTPRGRREDHDRLPPRGPRARLLEVENTIPIEVDFVEELGSDAYIYGHPAGADAAHGLGSSEEGSAKQLIVRVARARLPAAAAWSTPASCPVSTTSPLRRACAFRSDARLNAVHPCGPVPDSRGRGRPAVWLRDLR